VTLAEIYASKLAQLIEELEGPEVVTLLLPTIKRLMDEFAEDVRRQTGDKLQVKFSPDLAPGLMAQIIWEQWEMRYLIVVRGDRQ